MKELNNRQEEFYRKWDERRKKKWRYVLLHGSVYWGMLLGIAVFLGGSHFKVENMQLHRFIAFEIVFTIGGLFQGPQAI
jgi:hypothetical protein